MLLWQYIEDLTFVLLLLLLFFFVFFCFFVVVFFNLLNELGKRDQMRGLPSILSLYRNEFNKFNNIRARMFDSILSYDI